MQRNIELLQQTMQHIKDHPDQHVQDIWAGHYECGTVACFAGWAALLSGWSVKQIEHSGMFWASAELLGLTLWEADTLFHEDNSRPMLELMVKDLVNGDKLLTRSCYRTKVAEAH